MNEDILQRILVTGAHGAIGKEVEFGVHLGHNQLDVTSKTDITSAFKNIKPSGVLHLASLDLRTCESFPRKAIDINVFGVYQLALVCRAANIPLILISSGAVFYGPKGSVFTENDEPAPVNLYGQTKYLSEKILQEILPEQTLIVRAGWVFGESSVTKFVSEAKARALRGEPIAASDDQTGSPLYVRDLVRKIRELIVKEERGLHHVANSGIATAKQIANEIIHILNSSSIIEDVGTSEFVPTGLRRSPSEALGSIKDQLRPWQDSLRDYLLRD